MRLINVKTLRLEEFLDDNIPPYAILSHTWGNDTEELTIRDVEHGEVDKPGVGSVKLQGCCKQAEREGLGYAWIDTCCIDKTNLVELSEAINSMFRWYSRASICYAYLSDVPGDDDPWKPTSKFRSSRWFSRGWTLQELLAPSSLCFYNSEWCSLGTKGHLSAVIEKVANIPRQFLLRIAELHNASVAQRMSWAARRVTKRKEDLAYSLLGIFGVAMPMIYGEGGEQAFFRLQEQIMRTTTDDSILAWGLALELEGPSISNPAQNAPGKALAATPSDFADCGNIVSRKQFARNSLGISGGSLRVYLSLITSASGTIGLLSCGPEHDPEQAVGIPLTNTASDEYFRPIGYYSVLLLRPTPIPSPKLIHIENNLLSKTPASENRQYWFLIDGYAELDLKLIDVEPRSCWDKERALIKSIISSDKDTLQQTFIRLRSTKGSQDFLIALEVKERGLRREIQPHFMICHKDTALEEVAESFRYLAQRVCGKRYASNGILNLRLEWEPAGRPVSAIRLEIISSFPEDTVDITLELQILNLRLEFIRILEVEKQNGAEEEGLATRIKKGNDRMERVKKEREMLDDKIAKLQEKRRILLQEEDIGALEVSRLTGRQEVVKEKQASVSEQRLRVQERWGEVWRINCRDGHKLRGMDSLSLLQWACENGSEAVVHRLLAIGDVDFNSKTSDSWAPLHKVSRRGHRAVAALLLDWGAAIEAKDKNGLTPLHAASENGQEAVAALLLDRGAAIEAKASHSWTPLHVAAWNGYEAVVALLLDRGATIEAKTQDGLTPLHAASWNGYEAVAALLLNRDAAIEAKANYGWTPLHATSKIQDGWTPLRAASKIQDGWTPLHAASENGQEAIAALLLDRGAAIEAKDQNGSTPLHAASWNGYEAVAALLLDRGAAIEAKAKYGWKPLHAASNIQDGWTPLHAASENGQEAVVALLLNRGAAIEAKAQNGSTPLHAASENGQAAVAALLLDRGAAIEAMASYGSKPLHAVSKIQDDWTPLHAASRYGQGAVAALLLDRGAAIEAKDKSGWTPLYVASWYGQEVIAALLLDRGAAIEAKDKNGLTPLQAASWNGQEAVAALLLESGAVIETKDKDGRTPLHAASWNGQEAVAALLLDRGAVIEAKDKDGRTPLRAASWNGQEAVATLLLNRGALIEAKDKDGRTPLHAASWNGQEAVAALLLDRGAVIEAKDKDGWTPLRAASSYGYKTVAALLLNRGASLKPPSDGSSRAKGRFLKTAQRRFFSS